MFDLEPVNDELDWFTVRITQWQFIYVLLELGDADLTEWSNFNDGEFVSQSSAYSWGQIIRKIIPKLNIERIPNRMYHGGYEMYPSLEEIDNVRIIPMNDSTKKRLKEIADFFEESQGFYIY